MDTFQQSLRDNPISNRQQAVQLLLDLCRPLKKHYNKEGSLLHLGSIGAHYGEKTARMEAGLACYGALPLYLPEIILLYLMLCGKKSHNGPLFIEMESFAEQHLPARDTGEKSLTMTRKS